MLRLSGVLFGFQFVGDGTSDSITVDLTSSAASIAPAQLGFMGMQFTPNFNINSATEATAVAVNGGFSVVSASVASGKVTIKLNVPPSNGQVLNVTGALVF